MNEPMNVEEHASIASRLIAGGVNSNVRMSGPLEGLCFTRGEGSKLYGLDGREYVDYALGMGPALFGHAPGFLVDAVSGVLRLGQVFAGQHPLEIELARRLKSLVRSAELVRIGCTGSEMVQAAIRVARAFTQRSRIIKFEGHYHGWFDSVLVNLSGPPNAPGLVPFPLHLQTEGQSTSATLDVTVLPWNSAEAIEAYLGRHHADIAAVIMEPVMCNTGVIPPRSGYLEHVRDLCTRYGIVFIMDEVVTGFRLGTGGAQERFGVRPDLSVFAKALGGGFPIAALAGRADIMNLIGSGRVNHSGTYNANLMSVAAGTAILERLSTDGGQALQHIEKIGGALIEGMRAIAHKRGVNLEVTGFPAVFHTFFTDEPDVVDYFSYRRSDAARLRRFIEQLPAHGIRPMSRGTWFLSTAHTQADVELTLEAVDAALARL